LEGKQRAYKALALFHNTYNSAEDVKPEFWDSVIGMGGTLIDIWNETRPPRGAVRKPLVESEKGNTLQNIKGAESKRRIKPFGCDSNQPICCPWGASTLDQCRWNDKYPWSEPYGPTRLYGNKQSSIQYKNIEKIYGETSSNINAATNLTSACNYYFRSYDTQLMYSTDSREHDSGSHRAATQIRFECERTATCFSTCTPKILQSGADDDEAGVHYYWGLIQPYHPVKKDNSLLGTSSNGNPSTLTCKGGMAYAFNSCFFPDCAFSVSFSWAGTALQSSGGALWNVAHSRENTCSFPTEVSGGTTNPGQCGPGTGSYCFYSSNGATCNPGTFAFPPCCCFWSPIVIDISRPSDWAPNSGTGYQFTDVAGGVRFDLDGNGVKEQVAWPTATSENAWLVLDRNGNGVIDSGKELFGNFTDQSGPYGEYVPPGQGNGWQALAAFDRRDNLGGNQDQIISRADVIFENLRLWVDRNHNGISEPNELITLESIGITKIDYNYLNELWTDAFGNSFRFKGKFIWGDLGEEPYVEWYKAAWDVFPQWAL
jgi:hypothetical protein